MAAAPSAEDLLRGVQSDEAPKPAASPRAARVQKILDEVADRTGASARPSGLRSQTAEDLLKGAASPGERIVRQDAGSRSGRTEFDRPARTDRSGRPGRLTAARRPRDQLADIFVTDQKGSKYAGNDRCLNCHARYGEEGRGSLFALYLISQRILVPQRRGCEGCHGPGLKHADGEVRAITNPRRLTKDGIAQLCYSCHVVGFLSGDRETHFPGHAGNHVSCLNCHRVHEPAAEKALKDEPNRLCMSCHKDVATEFLRRSKHPVRPEGPSATFSNREGKMRCIDCHRNWSRSRDPNGREPTVETCQACHAETRGPFLFNHDAGSAEMVDGCVACHLPHGSPNRHLLRQNARFLCVSCHTDFAIGHFPGPSCTTTGCHTDIHGSNTNVFMLR